MSQQKIISVIREALSEYHGTVSPGGIDPATDVMIAVLFGMDMARRRFSEAGFPGEPSVTDYAEHVVEFLTKRYNR